MRLFKAFFLKYFLRPLKAVFYVFIQSKIEIVKFKKKLIVKMYVPETRIMTGVLSEDEAEAVGNTSARLEISITLTTPTSCLVITSLNIKFPH